MISLFFLANFCSLVVYQFIVKTCFIHCSTINKLVAGVNVDVYFSDVKKTYSA